uniref:Uncharacterized protein n=1 Tax=Setaria viridis TaxID=4556 RepID=A0A4U6W215_SETVI|nr:hypothetical protein SEVIR_2G365200v2 [Setaria viridis]
MLYKIKKKMNERHGLCHFSLVFFPPLPSPPSRRANPRPPPPSQIPAPEPCLPTARRPSDPRLRACPDPHGGGGRRGQGAGTAAAAPAVRAPARRVPQLRRARGRRRGGGGGRRPQDASEFRGTGAGVLVLKFPVIGSKTLQRGRLMAPPASGEGS